MPPRVLDLESNQTRVRTAFAAPLADVVSFIYGAEMQVAPESRLSWMVE
jgi:hypothetical protein